jgi:hypothetical protein
MDEASLIPSYSSGREPLSFEAIDGYRKAAARVFMAEDADPADVQLAYDTAHFCGAIQWGDLAIVAFDIDNQLVLLGGS